MAPRGKQARKAAKAVRTQEKVRKTSATNILKSDGVADRLNLRRSARVATRSVAKRTSDCGEELEVDFVSKDTLRPEQMLPQTLATAKRIARPRLPDEEKAHLNFLPGLSKAESQALLAKCRSLPQHQGKKSFQGSIRSRRRQDFGWYVRIPSCFQKKHLQPHLVLGPSARRLEILAHLGDWTRA